MRRQIFRWKPTSADMKLAPGLLRMLQRPAALLKQVGAIFVSDAQRAFERQRLGVIIWKPRYPNRPDPFISPAGVVSDLAQGDGIKARRYTRRPAGWDTGATHNKMAFKVIGNDTLEVGSPTPQATIVQRGGTTVQPITQKVRDGLAKAMRGARKGVKKMGRNLKERTSKIKALQQVFKGSAKASKKLGKQAQQVALLQLGWLFSKKSLKTKVVPRPFLGPTRTALKDAGSLISDLMRQEAR